MPRSSSLVGDQDQDELHPRQITVNLKINAIKFTEEDKVVVTAELWRERFHSEWRTVTEADGCRHLDSYLDKPAQKLVTPFNQTGKQTDGTTLTQFSVCTFP